MPSVEFNQEIWNRIWPWSQQGEEWSAGWGNAEAQWFFSIYPRIHSFLPATTILEIAPGRGRWTEFLKNHCEQLIAVDLAETCIDYCRNRFAAARHLRFYVNDGKSLDMVPDETIDFAFSYDSLVHADADVIHSYLRQLSQKLMPNGVGFLHHSNLGQYIRLLLLTNKLPKVLQRMLYGQGGLIGPLSWRSWNTSADLVERYCEEVGLQCISQETVTWGTKILLDCFTVFVRKDSTLARPNVKWKNRAFDHKDCAKPLATLYTGLKGDWNTQQRRPSQAITT
ncbi:class I SAM-dependent methyltransferase [Candidatus Nitrospira bockiana]